jgi:hypothetical protein
LLDDGRIRIRTNNDRIREAQKLTDPDPHYWLFSVCYLLSILPFFAAGGWGWNLKSTFRDIEDAK